MLTKAEQADKGRNTDQSEDQVTVAAITLIVREADEHFQRVGGPSRHWVRDCFLPALNQHGWFVEAKAEDIPSAQAVQESEVIPPHVRTSRSGLTPAEHLAEQDDREHFDQP